MNVSERGQVTGSAAEIYDEFFVPALFQQWADRILDAAGIQPGDRVLDVACGTGVLAHAAADRVGAQGSVVGVDINQGMLAVARRKSSAIDWREGRAEALPLDSNSFDAVVSQFGLMFFEDQRAAIHEMLRVLRPGGRLALAVWDSLEHTPGYLALAELLQQLFGEQVAATLQAPYVLGDREILRAVLADAGASHAKITTQEGTARFPSLGAWIYTDVKGWTAADMIDDAGFERLTAEAEVALRRFVASDGTIAFSAPAHIVTISKP